MAIDENGIEVTVYTHGSASTKTKDGGWAYMAVDPLDHVVDLGGGALAIATPLEADLSAMDLALRKIHEMGYRSVAVTTDSPIAEQIVNKKVYAKAFHVGAALQKVQQAAALFDFVLFSRPMKRTEVLEKIKEMEASVGEVE